MEALRDVQCNLDVSDQDDHEPTERDAGMHVSQQFVAFPELDMEQTVAEPFLDVLRHYLRIDEGLEELLPVFRVKFCNYPYGAAKTPQQHEYHSDCERKDKVVKAGRVQFVHFFSSLLYIRLTASIRCLVLIPRGHTIVHFPHSMHADIILNASSSLPL